MISLSSFSQTDIKIQQVPNNDTVKLHVNVAKKIVKDLLYLDVVKKERVILLENIDTLNSQKVYKDSIISLKDTQIRYFRDIISAQDEKEKNYNSIIKVLESDLKKQKLSSKICMGMAVLAISILFIK